jgi:hypothetical protein
MTPEKAFVIAFGLTWGAAIVVAAFLLLVDRHWPRRW